MKEKNIESRYEIVTNRKGHKILVVNRILNVDMEDQLQYDDFDAIFINVAHRAYEKNRLIVRRVSPIRVRKCFLKPLFATITLKEEFTLYGTIVDGYCSTPFDEVFVEKIEQINNNINRLGVQREMSHLEESTVKNLTNFIKYDISRGRLTFTNAAIRGLAKGFSADFLSWYGNEESFLIDDRVKFVKMLETLEYARRIKHIARVHTCPNCGDGHLLFIECCPKCGSSNIHEESIIHHFRCANLSPESTYQWDGELRCPKCKKILRHIGVDYDRPASAHHCNECDSTFINSSMKVICSHCHQVSTPDGLLPLDIYEYELTEKGIYAFAGDEALLQISNENIFSGLCDYGVFNATIMTFSKMAEYDNHVLLVFRYRYSGVVRDWRLMDIVRNFLSHIVTFKVTSFLGEIFTMTLLRKDKADVEALRLREIVDRLFQEYQKRDENFNFQFVREYIFDKGRQSAEEFIQEMNDKVAGVAPQKPGDD